MKNRMSLWIVALALIAAILAACTNRDPNLSGRTWQLVSYGPVSGPTAAAPDLTTSLAFGTDGTMNANMGCNYISGDYKTSGGRITFGPLISTMMACLDNGSNQQESAFISTFTGSVEYKIDGNTLTIAYNGGQSAIVFVSK